MARKGNRSRRQRSTNAVGEDPTLETNENLSEISPDDVAPSESEPVYDLGDADEVVVEEAPDHEERSEPRVTYQVRTVVQVREDDGEVWKEVVEIATVSKKGAGLMLSRPCQVGRIISLVMDMPKEMRAYDHFAPAYPVLGLVQNCTGTVVDGDFRYHVGVAFFGKKWPDSHRTNPKQTYRISGTSPDGLWSIVEAPSDFLHRRHSRFWHDLEVSIALRDEEQRSVDRLKLRTRDVSQGGIAVWGPLRARVGDRAKIICAEPSFFSMATVRNRTDHRTDEDRSIIHFEFDNAEFPVELIVPAAIRNPRPSEPNVGSEEFAAIADE